MSAPGLRLVAFFSLLLAIFASASADEWHSKLERMGEPVNMQISNKEMRSLHLSSEDSAFTQTHAVALFGAMADKKSRFVVREAVDTAKMSKLNLGDFDSESKAGFYNVKTTYTMHTGFQYLNLDEDAAAASGIRKLTAARLTHCVPSSDVQGLQDRTILVSASAGAFAARRLVQSASDAKPSPLHVAHLLLVAAPYVQQQGEEVMCAEHSVEPMHPWELFASMNIQALVDHPMHSVHNPEAELNPEAERNLGAGDDIPPDAPLKSCKTYPTDLFIESNWVRLGRTMGCAYAIGAMPGSIAANYNWGTKSAAQAVLLGPVTCDNCFVVAGTACLAVINYTSVPGKLSFATFYAELMMVGAAGASVSLRGNPGQWSGQQSYQLANSIPGVKGGTFTVRVGGTGLSLRFEFAGANALLRGTGTSTGSFSVAYGKLGHVNLGAIYNMASGFSATKTVGFDNLDKPFKNNGFTVTNWQATVDIRGNMNVAITFASIITANFQIFVGGTVSIQSPAGTTGSSTAAATGKRRSLGSSASTPAVYRPGDRMQLTHTFHGYNKDEHHTAYFSLRCRETGREYPIASQEFYTGADGSGSCESHYVMPWNLNFAPAGQSARLSGSMGSIKDLLAGQGESVARASNPSPDDALDYRRHLPMELVVRTSAYMEGDVAASQPFAVSMFTGDDHEGVFTSPKHGDRLTPGDVHVAWHHEHLHEFKKGFHSYQGQDAPTETVGIELVAETLNADSSVQFSQRHYVGRGLPNSGSATVRLNPQEAPFSVPAGSNVRYYLLVSSEGEYQVQGWSAGYFTMEDAAQDAAAEAVVVRQSAAMMPVPARALSLDRRIAEAVVAHTQSALDPAVAHGPVSIWGLYSRPGSASASGRALQKAAVAGPVGAAGATATSLTLPVNVNIYMGAGITSVTIVVFGSITFNKAFKTNVFSGTYSLTIAGTAAPAGTPCTLATTYLDRYLLSLDASESQAEGPAVALTLSTLATDPIRVLQRAAKRGAAAVKRGAATGAKAVAGAVCAWRPGMKPPGSSGCMPGYELTRAFDSLEDMAAFHGVRLLLSEEEGVETEEGEEEEEEGRALQRAGRTTRGGATTTTSRSSTSTSSRRGRGSSGTAATRPVAPATTPSKCPEGLVFLSYDDLALAVEAAAETREESEEMDEYRRQLQLQRKGRGGATNPRTAGRAGRITRPTRPATRPTRPATSPVAPATAAGVGAGACVRPASTCPGGKRPPAGSCPAPPRAKGRASKPARAPRCVAGKWDCGTPAAPVPPRVALPLPRTPAGGCSKAAPRGLCRANPRLRNGAAQTPTCVSGKWQCGPAKPTTPVKPAKPTTPVKPATPVTPAKPASPSCTLSGACTAGYSYVSFASAEELQAALELEAEEEAEEAEEEMQGRRLQRVRRRAGTPAAARPRSGAAAPGAVKACVKSAGAATARGRGKKAPPAEV